MPRSTPISDGDPGSPVSGPQPSAGSGQDVRWATKGDWVGRRAHIERLYIDEDKSLREVKEIMARDHGFHATDKMYKSRLKTWKLEKNLRRDEVLAMMRVKTRRDQIGRTAEFWRNGKLVTPEMLTNYLRFNKGVAAEIRKHVLADLESANPIEALLPRHITVLSPMTPLKYDKQLHDTESMIVNIRDYMEGALSGGIWVKGISGNWDSTRGGDFHAPLTLRAYLWVALRMVNEKHKLRAAYLNLAFSAIRPTIQTENASLAVEMTMLLFDIETQLGRPEIARIFIDYVARVSGQCLGEHHPATNWFKGLCALKKDKVATYEVLVRSFEQLVRVRAGRHNQNVTHCVIHYGKLGAALDPGFRERELAELSAEINEMKQDSDPEQMRIVCGLERYRMFRLTDSGRYQEAYELIQERTREDKDELALAQEALGNIYASMGKMEESREAFLNYLEWWNKSTRDILIPDSEEPQIYRIRQYYMTEDALRRWGHADIADLVAETRDRLTEQALGSFNVEDILLFPPKDE